MVFFLQRAKKDYAKSFMMGIFIDFDLKIPPCKNYADYLCSTKTQDKVARDWIKHKPFKELKNDLFNPKYNSNVETNSLIESLGLITASTLIDEFADKRKVTMNHLSCAGGKYSWNHILDEEKKASLGSHTKNTTESAFGSLTKAITKLSMIIISHASALLQRRQNRDFSTILLWARKRRRIEVNF